MIYKKKLIEVALPLDAINVASAREKSILDGSFTVKVNDSQPKASN